MSAPCMGNPTHFTRKKQLSAVPTNSDYPFRFFKLFLQGLVAGGKSNLPGDIFVVIKAMSITYDCVVSCPPLFVFSSPSWSLHCLSFTDWRLILLRLTAYPSSTDGLSFFDWRLILLWLTAYPSSTDGLSFYDWRIILLQLTAYPSSTDGLSFFDRRLIITLWYLQEVLLPS